MATATAANRAAMSEATGVSAAAVGCTPVAAVVAAAASASLALAAEMRSASAVTCPHTVMSANRLAHDFFVGP